MIERSEKIELAKIARDGIAEMLRRAIERGDAPTATFAERIASLAYYNNLLSEHGAAG